AGLDAMFVTPGPGLRYLTGYDARVSERLTCLVLPTQGEAVLVVPRLELPTAQAAGVDGLDIRLMPWDETEDAVHVAAGLATGSSVVALDDRMWAEKALRFRAALPGSEQIAAGPILSELRIIKSDDERDAL